jgi:hypothetical protein
MCPDFLSSLGEKTETDRYSPFVIAANDALEKLQSLDIQGLKCAPEEAERIIFLANSPNGTQVQSGEATSHRKPGIVIMRLSDAYQAYPSSLCMKAWGQLKNIAPSGAKPRSFHRILSCVEFKATRSDLKMTDCLMDGTPLLDEMGPMPLIVDGPAIRTATRAAEKGGQVERLATRESLSGRKIRKRPHECVDAGDDSKSQPQSAKRVAVVGSGTSRSWYTRAVKESPTAPSVALPKQTTGSEPQTRTQEKTTEFKARDPISQAGSYAIEMLSMPRIHAWNILIIGACLSLGPIRLH